jgi:uncharacterized RDD family membrane protein YckC
MERKDHRCRIAAASIDLLIAMVAAMCVGFFAGITRGPWAASAAAAVTAVGYSLIEMLSGASPGKRFFGLRIGGMDGAAVGLKRLACRWAIKHAPAVLRGAAVISMLGFFDYLAGAAAVAVAVGWSSAMKPGRQALHDRLTGTAVYDAAERWAVVEEAPPAPLVLPGVQKLREAA